MKTGRRHLSAVGAVVAAFLFVSFAETARARAATPECGEEGGRTRTIVVPPGANQLAAAVAMVEPGGVILLRPGRHAESGTITIRKPLTLRGEAGAVLEVRTSAATRHPLWIDPAIRIQGTSDVRLEGITLRPRRRSGGAGVLIEDASSVTVADSRILDHQFGVVVQRGAEVTISGNAIVGLRDVTPSAGAEGHGVVIVNGHAVRVDRNTISSTTYGIWASDRDGEASGNVILGSRGGIALGKIPSGLLLISGSDRGSDTIAMGWSVRGNLSSGNAHGYLLGEGASRIDMGEDRSIASGIYDVEVACDAGRYDFASLSSFESWVAAEREGEMRAMGCGRDLLIAPESDLPKEVGAMLSAPQGPMAEVAPAAR